MTTEAPDVAIEAPGAKVRRIVEGTSNEKVKELTALCPGVKALCIWSANSDIDTLINKHEWSSYSPLVHSNRCRVAEQLGSKDPREFLELFIGGEDGLLDHVVTETIRYAHTKYTDLNFSTNKEEMKVFIGILLLSGYHKLPHFRIKITVIR